MKWKTYDWLTGKTEEIWDVKELRKFLKLGKNTIYEILKKNPNAIPHVRRGKQYFFYKHEIEAWLRNK